MDKVLLHCCCAPCSVYCVDLLRSENIEPTAFWYNPNIHLYSEYKMRRDTLVDYANDINMQLIVQEEYGLDKFVKAVVNNIDARCNYCYSVRLAQTAKMAKNLGYEAFSSTLLISPYQDGNLMRALANKFAREYGVEFLDRDFALGFREGQTKAREIGLYMQKYCGCVFSEEERYEKKIKKDLERFKFI